MNYFELFEMPVSLNPDIDYINKKYLELQKKYHPDYFTLQTDEEQGDALQISAQINEAVKILKNQDRLIQYVLYLRELLADEEKFDLPGDFLMEMMELNESLMEEEDTLAVKQKVDEIENGLYAEILPVIDQYDDKTITSEDLLKLKAYYFKKKYVQRILDRIDG